MRFASRVISCSSLSRFEASVLPSLPPSLHHGVNSTDCQSFTTHFFGRQQGRINLVKGFRTAVALSARFGESHSKAHRGHWLSHRPARAASVRRFPVYHPLEAHEKDMSPFSFRIAEGLPEIFQDPRMRSRSQTAVLLLASLAAAAAFTPPLAPSFARPSIPAVKINRPPCPHDLRLMRPYLSSSTRLKLMRKNKPMRRHICGDLTGEALAAGIFPQFRGSSGAPFFITRWDTLPFLEAHLQMH